MITINRHVDDPTRLLDGTIAYRILGYADSEYEALNIICTA
jgi:hypothetical protein